MLTAIKDWLGFGGRDIAHGHGHDHDGGAGGHGHTHGVIDPSPSSSERGIWAIKWSLVILAITAILQLIVVFMSGSVALLADTIHNIGDATTAIPLWIAFVLVRRKPTATFNYGLGRVEDLAGMVIVLIILFSAIVAAWEAIDRLMNPQPNGHDHGRSGPALAFVTGLVPCPLTTFIMTYAVANGLLVAGLILSETFAAGMVVTVAAFPLLAVLLRTRMVPLMARTERLRERTGHHLEIAAALAVIMVGVWPLIR